MSITIQVRNGNLEQALRVLKKKSQKAGILKGSKLPTSKAALKMAKSKGAMKSLKVADTKSKAAFTKIVERYTGRAKSSMFKKSVKTPSKKPYSLDTREVQYLKKVKKDWGF